MKLLYIFLIGISIALVTSCNYFKTSEANYYYVIIEDHPEDPFDVEIIVSEIIEAPTDSEAITKTLGKIMAHLCAEARVASMPATIITKIKPHKFYINIFEKNGNLIKPTSYTFLKNNIEWYSSRSMWNETESMKKALAYYRNNTNAFSNPEDMFVQGEKISADQRLIFNPSDYLKIKYEDRDDDFTLPPEAIIGLSLLSLALLILFIAEYKRKSKIKKISGASTLKTKPTIKKPTIKMLNREGSPHADEWHTYIVGLRYHASVYDIGGFTGWVENDLGNAHDSKAMGIYNSSGKLLGYIPARELADYRQWCLGYPVPCVGFVFVEDGQYRGRVKILLPCNKEFLQTEFTRYLQWVKDNYGNDYLPKSLSMNFDIE